MSNFQKYIGTEVRTFALVDLTAVPQTVYDFGTKPVPPGFFQSDAGPATGVFDNEVGPVTSNVMARSGGYVYTTLGAPNAGTFAPPMLCYDLTGSLYACTTPGTPGTWQQLVVLGTGTFAPALPVVGSFAYDGSGNVTADPEGHAYTYNGDGTVATETFNGVTRTYNWASGVLTSVS